MADLSMQTAQRIATLIYGSLKGMTLYPPGHPSVTQPLQELNSIFRELLGTQNEISLGVIDGILIVGDHLFVTPTPAVAELAERLTEKDIIGVIILRGVQFDELVNFITLLSQKGMKEGELESLMKQKGITNIRVNRTVSEEETSEDEVDTEIETRETYNKTLDAIRGVFQDIETGRIPNSEKVLKVVNNLVSLTINDSSTLLGLAMIKDYDNYTFNHSVNVGILSMALGSFTGMKREDLRDLGMAGLLHDIGKTLVHKDILNKPGKLSDAEFEEMKNHPKNGLEIVKRMDGINPSVGKAVLGHHIQHNRQGYPEWAQKEPFNSMPDILAIADTYDALTTLRAYQHPHTPKAAIDRLRQLAGTMYDPALVEKFVEMMGSYPVGSLVRLDNNEMAVVCRPNPKDWESPAIKVIIDSYGEPLAEPRVENLAEEDGVRYASIVAVIDPLLKNIDVVRHIT